MPQIPDAPQALQIPEHADFDTPGGLKKKDAESEAALDFMRLARDRFKESADGESSLRTRMFEDRQFAAGGVNQWMVGGRDVQAERWKDGKPAITVNRIPGYTRQVTNSIREAQTGLQYVGVDDDHDPALAEILQGLARHVEQNSDADIAWETASEHQVEGGRGWVYARTEYVHDETDEQEIKIERVRNQDTVYPDVIRQKFDYSDSRYLHHVEDIPLEEHNRLYPECKIASLNEFSSIGDTKGWLPGKDLIRISNYYYIEHVEKTLVVLSPEPAQIPAQPGNVLNIQQAPVQAPPQPGAAQKRFLEDLNADEKARVMPDPKDKTKPMIRRKVKVPQVMYAKINGLGVIEGNEDRTAGRRIPGRYIPYVPVLGTERDLNGEVDLRGMVRDMREAAQMVNFWHSALTEAIEKSTKGTWIIAEGQVTDGQGGNQRFWDNANKVPYAYLPYKPTTLGDKLVPAPHYETNEPAIQAIVVALQIAENTLRALAGFYSVESQEHKEEQSGRAIMARQQQGERGSSHYHGNLARAKRHMGRILLHMFSEVYDTARVKRINGIDDEERQIMVYSGDENAPEPRFDKQQQAIKAFNLQSASRYDVRTTIGPGMATKRQEAVDAILALSKADPRIGIVLADLLVKNMDWTGAEEAAKRLKKTVVPPQALDDDGDAETKLMQAQAQLQQMGSVYDKLVAELHAKNDYIETEQVKHESAERVKAMELANKSEIAKWTLLTQLSIAGEKNQAAAAQQQVQVEADRETSAAKLAADRESNDAKLRAGIEQTHLKGVHGHLQQQNESLGRRIEMGLSQEHDVNMAEIQASHAREAQHADIAAQQQSQQTDIAASQQSQQTDISAQQDMAKQQPKAGQ